MGRTRFVRNDGVVGRSCSVRGGDGGWSLTLDYFRIRIATDVRLAGLEAIAQ